MRKHYTQMQPEEIAAVEARVRAVSLFLDPHTTKRMAEKCISLAEIEDAFRLGSLIELHNEADELRAVLRYDYGKKKNRVGVCIVVGLETGMLATAWKNAGNDQHDTLNISKYTWKVNAAALMPCVKFRHCCGTYALREVPACRDLVSKSL